MRIHRSFIAMLALIFAAPALAADLPSRYAAPQMAYAAAPVFSWAGPYIGASVGYAFNGSNDNEHQNVNTFGGPGGTYGSDIRGITYGAYAGYNFAFGSFVVGPELGLSGGNLRGSDNYPQYFNNTGTKVDWYGTASLRAGLAFDRTLFFVKGGVAYGDVSISQDYFPVFGAPAFFSQKDRRTGYVLGAGVEYALTNNFVMRGEYEYVNFGGHSYSGLDSNGGSTVISNKIDAHVAKLGVAYKF